VCSLCVALVVVLCVCVCMYCMKFHIVCDCVGVRVCVVCGVYVLLFFCVCVGGLLRLMCLVCVCVCVLLFILCFGVKLAFGFDIVYIRVFSCCIGGRISHWRMLFRIYCFCFCPNFC